MDLDAILSDFVEAPEKSAETLKTEQTEVKTEDAKVEADAGQADDNADAKTEQEKTDAEKDRHERRDARRQQRDEDGQPKPQARAEAPRQQDPLPRHLRLDRWRPPLRKVAAYHRPHPRMTHEKGRQSDPRRPQISLKRFA